MEFTTKHLGIIDAPGPLLTPEHLLNLKPGDKIYRVFDSPNNYNEASRIWEFSHIYDYDAPAVQIRYYHFKHVEKDGDRWIHFGGTFTLNKDSFRYDANFPVLYFLVK